MSFFKLRFWPVLLLTGALALAACDSAEERAEKHYQAALALLDEGDLDRASVEFRNVFALDDTHYEARLAFARALRDEGRMPDAYGQYLRLVETYPEDVEGRTVLGRLAFLGRAWDEFDRHAAEAVRLAPEDPEVRPLGIAFDYRQATLNEDASARGAAFERALAAQADLPDDVILSRLIVDGHALEGRYEAALAELDRLLEAEPETFELYGQKLSIMARAGDESEIEATLRQMVDRFPENNEVKASLIRYYVSRQRLDEAEAFLREIADPAAEDSGRWIDLIRFLEQVRGPEAALAAIEDGIAQNPRPALFQTLKAGLDFSQGRRDEAVAALEAIIAAESETDGAPEAVAAAIQNERTSTRLALAQMYVAEGNEVGAQRLVEEVLEFNPASGEALKMQAAWAIIADDTDAAIAALRQALEANPDDAAAMTLMAGAYTRSGEPNLSRDFLALAVEASNNAPDESMRYARLLIEEESYLAAEDVLIPALRVSPGNMGLLTVIGDLYLRMEDTGRTRQAEEALRALDTAEATAAANRLETLRRQAEQGPEEAMAFLENLAARGGDSDLNARVTLLRARLATGDVTGALQLAETLASDNPDNPVLAYALATTRAATGDLEGAVVDYRALLEEDPARPGVWLQLARIHGAMDDPAAAVAAIEDGLATTPDSPDLLWAQASYLEQQGDIDGAIAIYDRLYEQNSGSLVVANNLASLLVTYRDDPESLDRAWVVARRLNGTEVPQMQDTYGWLLFRRGEVEAALDYLEAASEGLPNDPVVQYHLAEAYAAVSRDDDALAQYRRTIEVAGPLDTRPQIGAARAAIAAAAE